MKKNFLRTTKRFLCFTFFTPQRNKFMTHLLRSSFSGVFLSLKSFPSIFSFFMRKHCASFNDKFTLCDQPWKIKFVTCHHQEWEFVETETLVRHVTDGNEWKTDGWFILIPSKPWQLHLVIYWASFIIISARYSSAMWAAYATHSLKYSRDKHVEKRLILASYGVHKRQMLASTPDLLH